MKKYIFTLLLLLLPVCGWGAEYYVSTAGNDTTGDGSSGNPWLTIQHAADSVSTGDTVNILAGTYQEYVDITNLDASAGQITFKGTLDANGNRTSIVDPGEVVTGWTANATNGAVYEKSEAAIGFTPFEMTVNGKRVGVIRSDYNATETWDVLTIAEDNSTTMPSTGVTVDYWDGIEAVGGSIDGTFYIRFADGSDPDEYTIKLYENDDTVDLRNCTNIKFEDLKVYAATRGFYFDDGSGHCDQITLENNEVLGGRYRVYIGTNASNCTVANSTLSMNYYGYDNMGAHLNGTTNLYGIREHIYRFYKYEIGFSSSDDISIQFYNAGSGHKIYGNTIGEGLIGMGGDVTEADIYQNTFQNIGSVGITVGHGLNGDIYRNFFNDCAIAIRLHDLNENATANSVDIYYNKSVLPRSVGQHIFGHWLSSGDYDDTRTADIDFWNNSFSGGYYGFYNARHSETALLSGMSFINNIFSTRHDFYPQNNSTQFNLQSNAFESWQYNHVRDEAWTEETAAWYGSGNVVVSGYVWNESDTALSPPSTAQDAGIKDDPDVPGANAQDFDGTTITSSAGYILNGFGRRPDIGAYERNQTGGNTAFNIGNGNSTATIGGGNSTAILN